MGGVVGHTIYYRTDVERWGPFVTFARDVARGIGYDFRRGNSEVALYPGSPLVEPLVIPRRGEGFAKTNMIEPHHSIYLLFLHSVAFFGSVELWED